MVKKGKAQISIEYLILMGFITFIIIGILGIAFFYGGGIKDKIKLTQMNNFANKVISTAESVFYAGEPSKATITAYLPENIKAIEISEDSGEYFLVISMRLDSGLKKQAFQSSVPLSSASAITITKGLKKLEIVADATQVRINHA